MSHDDSGGVRRTDPLPSHIAADSINTSRMETIVYATLVREGAIEPNDLWLTTLQLEKILKPTGIDKWSISPRMKPLEMKGLVETCEKAGLNSSGKIRTLTHYRALRHKGENTNE